MNRSPAWTLLMRVLAVVAGLVVVGLLLQLLGRTLNVLPAGMHGVLSAGWGQVWTLISPVVAPVAAVFILVAVIWVVLSGKGR